MASVKEELHALIDGLPDNATYDDARYAIYVRREIELGLKEAETGPFLTLDEATAEMNRWLPE